MLAGFSASPQPCGVKWLAHVISDWKIYQKAPGDKFFIIGAVL
jgi:hypothetical protein